MGAFSFRWDRSWKTFLSPDMPTFIPFMKWLTGIDVGDYNVEDEDDKEVRDIVDENTEVETILGAQRLDKLFRISVDKASKRVHLEFQSDYNKIMVERTLVYDLTKAEKFFDEVGFAEYYMPSSYIISVTDNEYQSIDRQYLTLRFEDNTVDISYPVVNALDKIPYLKQMMKATSVDEAKKYFGLLMDCIPGFVEDSEKCYAFETACGRILSKEVYEELGITTGDEKELSKVTKVFKGDGLTISERARRETTSSIIQKIMDIYGWTEQETKEFLNGGGIPEGSVSSKTSTLNKLSFQK